MVPFATPDDLTGYLPPEVAGQVNAADAPRLLARASEVVAEAATAGYLTDTAGVPVFESEREALAAATCAVVEQWLEVGEENDVAGYTRSTSVGTGGINVSRLPATLAPRAKRILRSAGLTAARAW